MKGASYKRGTGKYSFRGQSLPLTRVAEITGLKAHVVKDIASRTGGRDITESIENALQQNSADKGQVR